LLACLLLTGSYVQGPPVFYTLGGVNLVNATFIRATIQNSGSGNLDLYTAPAGFRAYVSNIRVFNGNAGIATLFAQIKISGTYYRLNANGAIAPSVGGNLNESGIILEPGDIISVNTDTANQNLWALIVQYPSTVPVYSPRLTSWVNGDNTLYTVPAGKTATALSPTVLIPNLTAITYANGSGGSRTTHQNIVNSGDSPAATNQATGTTTVLDKAASIVNVGMSLQAGDFITINSDANTAGQFAWMTVVEK
jgi:hypothetical protein